MGKELGTQLIESWIDGEGIQFSSPEIKEKYQKRTKRIIDAIQLRIPDQIPIAPCAIQKFAFQWDTELTYAKALQDFDRTFEAYAKMHREIEFDSWLGPEFLPPIDAFKMLEWRRLRLPGVHLPEDTSFQFVEGEYMRADEYDEYLADPSEWALKKYLPRLSPHLAQLGNLYSLHNVFNYSAGVQDLAFSVYENPEIITAFQRLRNAGEIIAKYWQQLKQFRNYAASNLGLPGLLGVFSYAPFDNFSNDYRGWRGIITDMYRQPQNLKNALKRISRWAIDRCIDGAVKSGNPIVTIYIMKGADPFMSEEQFEEFYWPSLRALIEALIEKGLLIYVFTQGCNDERLKYFAAFPPGNLVIHLESTTDIFKAKKVLAGKQCIDGNVPNSILTTGSEQDVEDYCRKLIDICGKEGGFIMDFSAFLDNCLISNIRKMVDVTQKYGKY